MSDRPSQIILIDHDPVFRLGLRVWLDQFADLQVVAEADTGTAALQQIAQVCGSSEDPTPSTSRSAAGLILAIVDLELGRLDPSQILGLNLCQQIKQQFSQVNILLLSDRAEPLLQAAAERVGADGFCWRNMPVPELTEAIRQVAAGQRYWAEVPSAPPPPEPMVQAPEPPSVSVSSQRQPSPFQALRHRLRQTGIAEIDAALANVTAQLNYPDIDLLTQSVLVGRHRELRAARWLVNRLLATSKLDSASAQTPDRDQAPEVQAVRPVITSGSEPPPPDSVLPRVIPPDEAETGLRSLASLILDAAYTRLQGPLRNRTGLALEIDILSPDRKRQLLYTILRQLTHLLQDLRQSQVQPSQLYEKHDVLLRDLWANTITEFFGKYYMVRVGTLEQEVVQLLLEDEATVEIEVLGQIPLFGELLSHLLFQTPLMVNGVLRSAGSSEALQQAEYLLDHVLIQVANAVMQPLLNRFSDVESIKRDFYDQRLLSTREIERFRNDLSWRYRLDRYINDPKDIFESQYTLLTFVGQGIHRRTIYAPRRSELETLSGIQYWVTLVLEFRDAIAPRLRAVFSFVGSGVIYVLTEVIGRGIGLVGRGILQGIGSAWQDSRFSRQSERQR